MSTTVEGGPGDHLAYEHGAGFLLSRLGAMADREWNAFISGAGLGQADFAILTVLDEVGAQLQRDAALRAAMDPRNAVPVVAALVERGLVLVERDEADRRTKRLRISEEGSRRLALLRDSLVPERGDFFSPLTPEEYALLSEMLARVYRARIGRHGTAEA
jgi:DNA-binding MarR family transcriptional regulator